MSEAEETAAGLVADVFAAQRVRIEPDQVEQFAVYLELLERWNKAVSLTSIRDRRTAILRHFVEPAMALPLLVGAGPRLLDAGSGAGCPGLPLKILDPERSCYLVESNDRKATFLREVVDALGLERVEVIAERLESEAVEEALDRPANILTSRAWTSGWGELLGRAASLLAPGARALLFTGEATVRELRRNLVPGRDPKQAPAAWRRAARAQWEVRRVMTLRHLDRGYLVYLELPSN